VCGHPAGIHVSDYADHRIHEGGYLLVASRTT